jgi:DNA-binding MarR family transcriptional regulator
MVDEISDLAIAPDNLRTLLYHLGVALDERLTIFRHGTPYEAVRPSDARVFVAVTRGHKTISEIARFLKITRQAAQISVHRLQALKVLDLEPMPHNKRDKHVVVTAKGKIAASSAKQQVMRFEAEFAAVIGEDHLALFRKSLEALLGAARSNNARDKLMLDQKA